MVQGRSSFNDAVAMIPISVSARGALFVLRLYDSLTPRQITRYAFRPRVGCAPVARDRDHNEWHNLSVVTGLVMFGLGQGALATQLFNVLVASAPVKFVGDVGALRATIRNLAYGVGTAASAGLVVSFLIMNIERSLVENPKIPRELIAQVDLARATFVSNERLKDVRRRPPPRRAN